ncbi:MAG: Gfo/Idh/MocA family oxidoreductase [Victivallales bacterium]|nr:Gfo/Idh/MocA family oxidoreductase [Victivallales bacterium]
MGIKLGLCGVGSFGSAFVSLFQSHPGVDEVYLADLFPDRLAEKAAENKVVKTFPSLDELCKSDCDAIAIFTQRWMHGPQAVQALKAGKHVYSAVPTGQTLEELEELVKTVEETGLTYMMGETSYYRSQTTFCRNAFAAGKFGEFVYGEGQYHHDMAHFYKSYMHSGKDQWKPTASCPPMLYPTHSTAFILAVTFRRMTEVSCFGYVDHHIDGIFDPDLSLWGNVFSNESALFRTSDGGMARVNEFRRTAHSMMDRMTITGTHGCYQEQPRAEGGTLSNVVSTLDFPEGYGDDGTIPFATAGKDVKLRFKDHNDLCVFKSVVVTEENIGVLPNEYLGKTFKGVSPFQPWQQLPVEFADRKNGHEGTHVFMVNDFVRAVNQQQLPPNHVWQAARYNAPGIVAHASAQKDGERLSIPDFGTPPAGAATMNETFPLQP